jgi:hypothetical protein
MNIEEYGGHLREALERSEVYAAPGSYLHRMGLEIHEMVKAYSNDGTGFFTDGDLVNALAAYTYGAGWLEAGCFLGIIMANSSAVLSNPHFDAGIPPTLESHLREKTERYLSMASAALEVIECAPDKGSILFIAAEEMRARVLLFVEDGYRMNQQNSNQDALGFVSYGYGMLDAGVRAGLFEIRAKRHLFTI